MKQVQIHELKVWPEFFPALVDGSKSFELRRDDRDFQVGDVLRLREWDRSFGFTGPSIEKRITYIARAKDMRHFGLERGWCLLAIADAEN